MDEFQRYIELEGSWQHNFSYPLIFQEYMFSFAYGHGKYSLLINHLILSAKNSNQNDFLGHKHNFYSQMISEGFSVIVEIPFSLLLIASPEREKISFYSKDSISFFLKRNQRLFLFLYNFHDFGVILWLFKDPSPHSVRYKGKSILASKGMSFLMLKWKFYLIHFWQCHFSVWSQPSRIFINRLSTHFLDFMGFCSSVQLTSSVVRNQMLENAFLIDNTIKKFDPKIPMSLLIGSLAKAQFCNGLGHPLVSRRICRNLFHYYSGSSRKKSLYRLKYILQLSCARTLARKHKSAMRAFLKRLGSGFLEEFFTEEEKVIFLILPKNTKNSANSRVFYRGCIWYLDIFCIHNLANDE
ncbi:hypothetical protein RND81_O292000 [Saponaria officinalis]|uniref:Maturase K n=1 Tax=Saponaria officinalis TaxID=3572 RepID=A0AAW1GIH0_SAPOF